MSPEAAREQVADGTSVLAVILSQYRSQVLTQASEHIAEQMRIVSRKLNAEVDRPVSIVVEESDGPEPQDLLFASQSEAGSSGSSESTASSDSTYANAGPEAREAAVAEQTERSYAVGLTAVAAVAWAAAVLAAAVAVSTAVDRATGLGIVVVGPWLRRSAERPVPRALKLRTKALLMALLVLLLAVGATLAAIVLAAADVVGSFAAWVAAPLTLLYNWVPGVVTAAALTVAVLIVAHLIVRGYDRRVSTRTALV